eukprot:13767993-Alexandrium_andersonii.AAC.1
MKYVQRHTPILVINENVDLSDDASGGAGGANQSNEAVVIDHYAKLGYTCRVLKLNASCYG